MRIDKRLNLVVPVFEDNTANKIIAYVHSTPLSEAVVDRYFMVLGQVYSQIFGQGLGLVAGPGHAMRVLRHVAIERGVWEPKGNDPGVAVGLVEEIRRLTMVAVLNKDGKWEQLPLSIAVDRKHLSEEDVREVENAIAFFIVVSATLNRYQREMLLAGAGEIWGAQTTSLTFMEFVSGLKTSTETDNSGEKSLADVSEKPAIANATVGGKPRSVPV